MSELDSDRLELYRLSAKKVHENGLPLTSDRIWDEFVSIAVRHYPEMLEPHDIMACLDVLSKESFEIKAGGKQ